MALDGSIFVFIIITTSNIELMLKTMYV